jgi:hypothetical protein
MKFSRNQKWALLSEPQRRKARPYPFILKPSFKDFLSVFAALRETPSAFDILVPACPGQGICIVR